MKEHVYSQKNSDTITLLLEIMKIPEGIDEELSPFEDSGFSAQDRLFAMSMDIDLEGPFY